MTRSAPDEALSLLRLHLRQRVELGETELLLDSLSRAELMAALSVVKTGVTQRGPAAETASAGGAPVGAEASSGTRPATRATPAAPVAQPLFDNQRLVDMQAAGRVHDQHVHVHSPFGTRVLSKRRFLRRL